MFLLLRLSAIFINPSKMNFIYLINAEAAEDDAAKTNELTINHTGSVGDI
jgi:hypothetical protein